MPDTQTGPQRYRRKPVEVEAMQYTAETCAALHEWLGWEHNDEGVCGEPVVGCLAECAGDCEEGAESGWWFVVEPSTRSLLDVLPDAKFREQYAPVDVHAPEIRCIKRIVGGRDAVIGVRRLVLSACEDMALKITHDREHEPIDENSSYRLEVRLERLQD